MSSKTFIAAVLVSAATLILAGSWLLQARHSPDVSAPHAIDIGFVQSMAVHHRQAVAMSQMMFDGQPTPLAMLARGIAYAQLLELGEMQGWLKLWEKPLVPRALIMDWMLLGDDPPGLELRQYLIDCERSPTGMPGLATNAELEKLRASTGRARDELFLKMMLAHHRGGIPMARFAARHARLKVVRDLAARIVLDQSREIDRMQRTLAAMAASLSSE